MDVKPFTDTAMWIRDAQVALSFKLQIAWSTSPSHLKKLPAVMTSFTREHAFLTACMSCNFALKSERSLSWVLSRLAFHVATTGGFRHARELVSSQP
jgi:hypothetical protein